MNPSKIAVIGGGAAGFFAAINIAEQNPSLNVTIYEKTGKLLSKVSISGGGRCNVTHSCFEPRKLMGYYPRGSKELLGAFHRFQPADTIEWFKSKNIELKTEPDGRIFPATNSSQTIINCFLSCCAASKINIKTGYDLRNIAPVNSGENGYVLSFGNEILEEVTDVIIAAGGSTKIWDTLENIGVRIVPPVPSLFSFTAREHYLKELSGVSAGQVRVGIANTNFSETGPLLITHNGFSGPAILQLSARAARVIAEKGYCFDLQINWTGRCNQQQAAEELLRTKEAAGQKLIYNLPEFGLPSRLWKKLLMISSITEETRWLHVSKARMNILAGALTNSTIPIAGKTANKEEFVTCGGVKLSEVDFRTMQSRKYKGLYFAGEALDIDGLTGGFNFQAAWTTAAIAAEAVLNSHSSV